MSSSNRRNTNRSTYETFFESVISHYSHIPKESVSVYSKYSKSETNTFHLIFFSNHLMDPRSIFSLFILQTKRITIPAKIV